ncbi:hypothetical protein FHS57_000735 [Runella defluvii]|uniref:Uncharacterized protein n=1 Tax=Runella defluvii TaxID=370973 RepID=A0A7W5ZH57_9BACT|nr:hypothetical protein [Runella defluvii]MBB3836753.1 hypothetical protein [Runella defluvii]
MSNTRSQQSRNQHQTVYNPIYEKLESDGLVGKIAYCFYKESKRAFIREYIAKNNGKHPSPAEVKKFVSLQESQHIDHFKRDAVEMVNDFFNALIEEHKKDLKIQILKEVHVPSFWSGIWQNIVASFLWTILIALLLPFIIRAAKIDLVEILRGGSKPNTHFENTVKTDSTNLNK